MAISWGYTCLSRHFLVVHVFAKKTKMCMIVISMFASVLILFNCVQYILFIILYQMK